MWRPLVEEHYDSANKAATLSQSVQRYDSVGHKIFASYPINNLVNYTSVNSGSHTSYDPLDRVTQVQQDSELGALATTTAYLAGFKTAVTDPKGNITTTAFMAYDQPTTDWPVSVTAPENITQAIVRDVFGSPTSMNQSGLYGTETNSVTKTLTYDSYHQVCRTTEPESGSEVMALDDAGNLLWSASGLAITGTGCGQEQVAAAARTVRTYNEMNRLKTILAPAGTQSTSYEYDPAGRMTKAVSGISTWNGTYNFRGMLTNESLQLLGQNTWSMGYGHNANGHNSLVSYPDGESVSYTPDALGRPTRVGNYANSIGYFPNGEVSGFLYGNGAVYVAEQNARQLVSNFTYGLGGAPQLSEDLAYDKTGNVTAVTDLAGGPRTKSFGYDALDRLTAASATGLWGTQAFTYDAINNLRTLRTGTLTSIYHYDMSNRLASISGAIAASYGYDNRGNMTTRNGANLLFDQKNQLTRVVGLTAYAYDAAARRVSKTPTTGSPAYYFYSQAGQMLYQSEPGNARATNFIYLGRKLLAENATASLGAPSTISFNANPNNGSYTVSWGAVPGATSYVLEESANGGAWLTVYTGAPASAALTGRAGGGYVYRVKGCIGAVCGALTSSATLGVTPTLPTVTVPTGTINGGYTVSWTAPASASTYKVQERLKGGAWNDIASSTTATSISRPGTTSGSYTYQVAASNAYGTRGWALSATVTVNTNYGVMPTPVPSYTIPATNGTGSITVSWSASAPVTQYTLQQSVNGGTSWSTAYTGVGTSVALSGLADGSYIYRLQACNNTADNSACTAWVAAGPMVVSHPPTTAPALTAPASSAGGSYTVSWGTVGGASSYSLQEQVNGGAWTTIQNTAATSKAISGKTNGTYGYRVQACNAGGCGPWSSSKITTVLLLPPAPASISIPATSSGAVAVSWAASATATSYTLQHAQSGVTGWSTIYTGAATGFTRNETTTGTWIYKVQACNASGCSAFRASSGGVAVTIPPGSAPSLSVPATSTTGSYTVSWGGVTGASSYTLQEQVNSGSWSTIQTSAATSKAISGKGGGSYGYRVQACNVGGCGPWSATKTLAVTKPPAMPASVTAPSYIHGTSYIVSWSAAPTATSYNVQRVNIDRGGTTIVATTSATSATMAAPTGMTLLQYSVQACNASGCSAFQPSPNTTQTDPPGPIR